MAVGNGCTHKSECALGYDIEPFMANIFYE